MEHTNNAGAQPDAIAAWVAADRRLDLAAMQAQLAEDVVLVSPLTDGFTFHGPHDVAQVFASAFDLLTDIRIHKVTGAGADWVVYGKNTLGRDHLEEIQWLHLNAAGKIDHITLFIRPVAAAVTLFAQIGGRMHARGLMPRKSALGSGGPDAGRRAAAAAGAPGSARHGSVPQGLMHQDVLGLRRA